MATVTRPSTPLPDPGDEMDAEQVRDWINNVLTFLESTNIDEANVDLTSTDGIVGKSTAQTMTGKKNFVSTNAAAAGIVEVAEFGLNPASGTAADNDGGRLVFYADDDGGNATDLVNLDWVLTDASNGSEDAEFRIRALKAGTMTEFLTAGSTAAGTGRVAVTGDLTVSEGTTIGGGYGSTGVTISTAGVIQANGAITSDGAVTGATLAGTISTAAQNSITSASSLATVGTITSGTWSGVIDGSATMTMGSDATGDIYYRNASGFLTRLAAGADGTVLTGTGSGSVPAWESPTVGDITSVVAGVGLSGGGTSGDVTLTLDISELSTVTPADGDFFATLDSDGANEQKTTTTALATLFAGAGMTASSSVLNVIGGDGITANANDVAITAAQTTITSIYNTSLKMGRDSQNLIDFATTDDKIILRVANVDEVELVANTLQPTTSDGVALGTGSLMWSDLFLADGSVVNFNNGDVTLTHSSNTLTVGGGTLATGAITSTGTVTVGVDDTGHDVKFFGASAGAYMEWDESEDQLRIMGASADAATSTGKLLLATSLTDINANDVLGKIDFQAPHEAGGTDATEIAASIQAIAQSTFSASSNATDLIFYTGHSEAATEKFRFTSQGEIGIGGANYGSDGQVLTSGGAGAAPAWETPAAGGIASVVADTSPQLGGNLDVNGQSIVSASNGNIQITPNGTGSVLVGVNDTGHDVKFFGATSGKYVEWDQSADSLNVVGTANAKLLNISASGAALASQNAHKIILVDLTDPGTMWDIEIFLARVRHTSWYEELGAPPMRGAIWITEAQTSMVWWNLDTDSQYIKFDTGGSSNSDANMLYFSASSPPASLAFLDGKIFYGATGGGGAWIIDFLRDECVGWFASGQRQYSGNVKERNDGNGNIATKSTAIVNGTVNRVAAVRDPLLYDEFDRPKHWWAVDTAATPNQVSVYSPVNDAIYDGGTFGSSGTATDRPVALAPNGAMAWAALISSKDYIGWIPSIQVISADWDYYNVYMSTASTGANLLPSFTSSFVSQDMAIYNAHDTDIVAVAGNEGLLLIYPYNSDNANKKGAVRTITSSYNTPYMKGTRVAAYPLNDVNDRSGMGHNLTNNNTVTFASGGPTGSYANFVAASSQSLTLADDADFGGMSELTLSCWVNRDIDAGADEGIFSKFSTSDGSNQSFTLVVYNGGGDTVLFEINTSGGTGSIESTTALALNEWFHIAATYDGATMKLYMNGVLEASTARTGTIDDSTEQFIIGARSGSTNTAANFFDGQIAGVFVGSTAMTEAEVKLEHQRGVRVLGGATATLANDNVKSVRIDQNSGLAAITTAVPSGGTAGQGATEIWDITTGLRESIDGTTTATVNDADVALKSGADDPEYITGRSGAIEYDGQARRVIG